MKDFVKFFFASCLSFLVGIVLLVVVFFMVIGGIAATAGDSDAGNIENNSILYITLKNPVVDHSTNDPLAMFSSGASTGLDNILKSLKHAAKDDRIKGIFIEVGGINMGMATVEELRGAMMDFKKSGKFIVAYSDSYSQGAYYLASVADQLYVNPQGGIDFKGIHAELIFLKGTLEKIGVEPQIIRHGKFKSAIEPLVNDKMSDANRLQTRSYVGAIWRTMLSGISASRKISTTDLQNIADSLSITDGASAVKYKLADGAKYKDEVLELLKDKVKAESIDKLNFIALTNYIKDEYRDDNNDLNNRVAVIFAEGSIVDGNGKSGEIGGTTLARQIREVRLDKNVKAVVLRINSPGGSALASDIIWREVDLLRKVKPVIVSMGNVAASGGYYIACAADTIVAQPNTITGSIGVFGVLWNAQGLYNKVGLTTDTVKFGKYADIGSVSRPMTEMERKKIQDEIERIYDVFITHVSDGRTRKNRIITKADVDSLGQGRVWSGIDAKDKGLVDILGGLDVAIDIAIKKAKLSTYSIKYLPYEEKGLNKFLNDLSGEDDDKVASILQKELGEDYRYLQYLRTARTVKGIQARLPYELEIQ